MKSTRRKAAGVPCCVGKNGTHPCRAVRENPFSPLRGHTDGSAARCPWETGDPGRGEKRPERGGKLADADARSHTAGQASDRLRRRREQDSGRGRTHLPALGREALLRPSQPASDPKLSAQEEDSLAGRSDDMAATTTRRTRSSPLRHRDAAGSDLPPARDVSLVMERYDASGASQGPALWPQPTCRHCPLREWRAPRRQSAHGGGPLDAPRLLAAKGFPMKPTRLSALNRRANPPIPPLDGGFRIPYIIARIYRSSHDRAAGKT